LRSEVTRVTPGNLLSVSEIAVNAGFLDFWKNGEKIERA